MTLQYYKDGKCAEYMGAFPVGSKDDFRCVAWYQSGSSSGNIADCNSHYSDGCNCTFYTTDDCTGAPYNVYWTANGAHSNCAYNGGLGFKAFICTVLKMNVTSAQT
jgi:hypothetical protein